MIFEIRMFLHRRMSIEERKAIREAGAFVSTESIQYTVNHDVTVVHYYIDTLQDCDIMKLCETLRGIE
ncbi:hypothetical protein [Burkholderia phage BCSR52]|uniref:Uncharacterized protein n=1 Tax=Burkholderia phage BCSR52 TaxID=2805748 RepID=A0A889IPZ3_9CAUD|nr:hypothetical protein [Burkholderia phage BCSR52]